MGYMRHHAIVVTASDYNDALEEAHAEAATLFPWVSPISPKAMNGYRAFFIPPDGSKESWGDSDEGDQRRDRFVAYLKGTCHADGSGPLDWVEVQYGDDQGISAVTRHSDQR